MLDALLACRWPIPSVQVLSRPRSVMPSHALTARHAGPVVRAIVCTIAVLLLATVTLHDRAHAAPRDGVAPTTGMQVMLAQGPPRRGGVPGIPGLPSFGDADDQPERFYDSRDEVHASVRVGARTVAQGGDLPIAVVEPDGCRTSFSYDENDWCNGIQEPSGARYTYSYLNWGSTAITDPAGNVTTVSYDAARHITGVTDPLGNTTSYSYWRDFVRSYEMPTGNRVSLSYTTLANGAPPT